MKIYIALICALFINVSSAQVPSQDVIQKDIERSDVLWEEGKLAESMALSEKILKDSKQISYSPGILHAAVSIAAMFTATHEFKKADPYIEIAESENLIYKSRKYTDEINAMMGNRYEFVGLEHKAIEAYSKSLNSSSDVAGAVSSNIAGCYARLQMPDSVLFYSKKAYQFLVKGKDQTDRRILAIVSVNIGVDYLHHKINLDSSRLYLNRGLLLAKEINQPVALQSVYKGLGLLSVKTRKTDSAIHYFKSSLAIAKALKDPLEIRDLYLQLGAAYEMKKQHFKQAEYMESYQLISDSLNKLNNLPFVVQSMIDENETDLRHKTKVQTVFVSTVAIFIAILIALFAYLRFKRYRNKQTRIIEDKDNQLNSASEFKTQYEIDALGELVKLAKAKDPAFFLKFNEFNPDFKDKILKKYPGLINDIEFCSYLRLNFSTKEIAIYANISVRAVEAKKYRIRKKMGISSTANINLMILEL